MKNKARVCLLTLCIIGFSAILQARDIPPIITTDWLLENLSHPNLVILDIRTTAQYAKGHIPGSLSAPFSLWAVSKDGLTMEPPSEEALMDLLGKSGISKESSVVLVNRTETDLSRADATRAAWTCIVAGIGNVAILDGGITKWVKENKPVNIDPVKAAAIRFAGKMNRSLSVSKDYVKNRLGKSILLDARIPDDYFGITSKEGHIRGAVNIPAPWAFSREGTLVKEEILKAMASGVIGDNKSREVIVYCGVGGFASTWWYILTQMLGYQNVKIYDGSFEEWIKEPAAPVRSYSWN